jgi:RNA polymerase sigma-70 factor (ECF subfamily)
MNAAGEAVMGRPAADASPASGVAFEAFARHERRPLVSFAWALIGDLGSAEDLAQDALEAAWRAWDRVGGYDKPGAWARRVVANRAAGHSRRRGRERRALGRLAGRPVAAIELEATDDHFWSELRNLPERQAHAVALHYLEDLSIAQIALVLDCAEGTVKVHLHRGRLALARALGLLDREQDR